MAENNNPPQNNEPIIADEDLKMPEEDFGTVSSENDSSYLVFILVALIIILILLLGGLYLWGSTFNQAAPAPAISNDRPTAQENREPESNNARADVETAAAMSNSTNLSAIEADLDSTNLDDLDADIIDIEAELGVSN